MGTTAERREAAVQWYLDRGLSVFPYDAKGLPFRAWPNPALVSAEDRAEIASKHWTSTYGVVLDGGIVVIDIDANRGGNLQDLEDVFGPLPPTATFSTPSSDANLHLMFRVSGDPLRTSKALTAKFPHIDFLGLGSHVKGATSWRRLDTRKDKTYSAATYDHQYPFLEPAVLPADIESAWRETMVSSDDELLRIEVSEAEVGLKPTRLTEKERNLLKAWIRQSLKVIAEATDGQRWDTLSRQVLAIYRNGMLLTGSTAAYDQRIIAAYRDSGGDDVKWLKSMMAPTRVFALKHPKPRPAVSAFQKTANATIGDWADAATAACGPREHQMRKVIAAIAAEAKTTLEMTTAASVMAARYKLGDEKKVQSAVHQLATEGWLVKTGERFTLSDQWMVNHYRLSSK